METTQQIMGMTDAEYGEHLKYDEGFSDGINGNAPSKYDLYAFSERYRQGFKTGREYLRRNYQRSLMNDYGPVPEKA